MKRAGSRFLSRLGRTSLLAVVVSVASAGLSVAEGRLAEDRSVEDRSVEDRSAEDRLADNRLAEGPFRSAPRPEATDFEVGYMRSEVLVRFEPETPPLSRADLALRRRLTLIRENERMGFVRYRLDPSTSVPEAVRVLASEPAVTCVQPNFIYRVAAFPQDPYFQYDPATYDPAVPNQYGLFTTFLPSLWRANAGAAGQVIAIVDTGIDGAHPQFSGRLVPGYDFVDEDEDPDDEHDPGHGTHAAGVACAAADNAGTTGVAYAASCMSVRVLGANGAGLSSDVAPGIVWAADHGARVISMSFTVTDQPDFDPEAECIVREAVAEAYAAGCVLVAASGNGGGAIPRYPAALDEVIAVGAVDQTSSVWVNSSYGDHLDVVAPGVDIWSTKNLSVPGGSYTKLTGTSIANPFVAGLCALLLSEFPDLRPWELERYLRQQTRNTDGLAPGSTGNRDGYGLVSFGSFKDWGNYSTMAEASSKNALFEWLGREVTGESSSNDVGAVGVSDGDDWQPDLDGVPNSSGEDGGDDGLFPASHSNLPFLPPHLTGGVPPLKVDLSVCDRSGPRYAGANLAVRTWVDWNDNSFFADPTERMIDGTTSPSAWASDFTQVTFPPTIPDDHFRGNPLRLRSRVIYAPAEPAPAPGGIQRFGEVEDQTVLNFVEDFDTDLHGAAYASLGTSWFVLDEIDHEFYPLHHGEHRYALNFDCDLGDLTLPETSKPPLDLREFTRIRLRFWIAHQLVPCGNCGVPGPDACRLILKRSDTPTGTPTEFVLMDFPDDAIGYPCSDPGAWADTTAELDLSAHAGKYARLVFRHETGIPCRLGVDDVFLWGYDSTGAAAAQNLSASLNAVDRRASLSWTHPNENDPAVPGDPSPRVSLYGARLWRMGNGSWADALRLTPRDFANAGSTFPVPGNPGSGANGGILTPSAFPTYSIGLRADDEVAHPGVLALDDFGTSATFDVSVITPDEEREGLPGESLRIAIISSNLSSIVDAVSLVATDSKSPSWLGCPRRWTQVLDGGQGEIDSLVVEIPDNASPGDEDLITVVARSLSDSTQQAITDVRIVVSDDGSALGACCSREGICQLLSAATCEAACGEYLGLGSTCSPNPCEGFVVLESDPTPNQADALWNPEIEVRFNRAVMGGAPTPDQFRIRGSISGPAPGEIHVAPDGLTATFTPHYGPDRTFGAGQLMEGGIARSLRSDLGDSLRAPWTWHFRSFAQRGTGNFTGPIVLVPSSSVTALAAGDLNQDGRSDLVAAGLDGKVTVYRNTTPDGGSLSYESFVFSVGSGLSSVLVADFDGDSDLDILAADIAADLIRVGLNGGNGSAYSWSTIPAGDGPRRLGIGDLDGDGMQDLAFPCELSDQLYVQIADGLGSIRETGIYALADTPMDLSVRDVDQDGLLDLVVLHGQGGQISVLRNVDPSASASAMFALASTQPVTEPRGLLVEDLNGDGRTDVAVATGNSAQVALYPMGACAELAGPTLIATGTCPASNALRGLDALDFDGDGDLDLAVTNVDCGRWVLLENDGTGAFTVRGERVTQAGPSLPLAADLNDDGLMDVAVPSPLAQRIEIFLGERLPTEVGNPEVGNPEETEDLARMPLRLWPNPFRDAVEIGLPEVERQADGKTGQSGRGAGRIEICNVAGRLVRRIDLSAGASSPSAVMTWDGRDEVGRILPAGVYQLRLVRDGRSTSRRVAIVR